MFSEDEAEGHVQAADGKQEKRGNEREFVNVVGEDRCPDAKRQIRIRVSLSSDEHYNQEKSTYSAWKIPSGPRPN
jgi:hypothetical protein